MSNGLVGDGPLMECVGQIANSWNDSFTIQEFLQGLELIWDLAGGNQDTDKPNNEKRQLPERVVA